MLRDMPKEFGPWKSNVEGKVSDFVIEELQCSGYVYRNYQNQETNQRVDVVAFAGPPGPISAHTPEICYRVQDYQTQDPTDRVDVMVDGQSLGSFWALTFRTNDVQQRPLRVYYAWSNGGQWQASDRPRFTFGGGNLLYKIQLSGMTLANEDISDPKVDPCYAFLQALLRVTPTPAQFD
jgi:hypothetical protein